MSDDRRELTEGEFRAALWGFQQAERDALRAQEDLERAERQMDYYDRKMKGEFK